MEKEECTKCGLCCRFGICKDGIWNKEELKCEFLTENNLCGIYETIKDKMDFKYCHSVEVHTYMFISETLRQIGIKINE